MGLKWIRDGLRKSGKTQAGLARALGLAPPAVSRLLKGERQLKADEVPVIARYLGVTPPEGTLGEDLDLPDDPMEAAMIVTEYVLQRSERSLDPKEKVRLVAAFRDLIERARHG